MTQSVTDCCTQVRRRPLPPPRNHQTTCLANPARPWGDPTHLCSRRGSSMPSAARLCLVDAAEGRAGVLPQPGLQLRPRAVRGPAREQQAQFQFHKCALKACRPIPGPPCLRAWPPQDVCPPPQAPFSPARLGCLHKHCEMLRCDLGSSPRAEEVVGSASVHRNPWNGSRSLSRHPMHAAHVLTRIPPCGFLPLLLAP